MHLFPSFYTISEVAKHGVRVNSVKCVYLFVFFLNFVEVVPSNQDVTESKKVVTWLLMIIYVEFSP